MAGSIGESVRDERIRARVGEARHLGRELLAVSAPLMRLTAATGLRIVEERHDLRFIRARFEQRRSFRRPVALPVDSERPIGIEPDVSAKRTAFAIQGVT